MRNRRTYGVFVFLLAIWFGVASCDKSGDSSWQQQPANQGGGTSSEQQPPADQGEGASLGQQPANPGGGASFGQRPTNPAISLEQAIGIAK